MMALLRALILLSTANATTDAATYAASGTTTDAASSTARLLARGDITLGSKMMADPFDWQRHFLVHIRPDPPRSSLPFLNVTHNFTPNSATSE